MVYTTFYLSRSLPRMCIISLMKRFLCNSRSFHAQLSPALPALRNSSHVPCKRVEVPSYSNGQLKGEVMTCKSVRRCVRASQRNWTVGFHSSNGMRRPHPTTAREFSSNQCPNVASSLSNLHGVKIRIDFRRIIKLVINF